MTIDAPEDDVTVARGRVQHMLESMNAGELQLLCVRTGIRAEFYPGEIKAVNADGTFTILFDDGDKRRARFARTSSWSARLRRPRRPRRPPLGSPGLRRWLTVGATVEPSPSMDELCNKIEGVNADGTFAILFDDGDKDRRQSQNVRSLAAPAASSGFADCLVAGAQVEVKFGGKAKIIAEVWRHIDSDRRVALEMWRRAREEPSTYTSARHGEFADEFDGFEDQIPAACHVETRVGRERARAEYAECVRKAESALGEGINERGLSHSEAERLYQRAVSDAARAMRSRATRATRAGRTGSMTWRSSGRSPSAHRASARTSARPRACSARRC